MVGHILFWNDSLHCCNCLLSLPCNSCNQLIVLGFSLTETRPTILFVVWSANSYGSAALTSKASSNLLTTVLTDAFVRVIVSSIRTNRARCALYVTRFGKTCLYERIIFFLIYL